MSIVNRIRRARAARAAGLSSVGLAALVFTLALSPVSDSGTPAPASGQGPAVFAPYNVSWTSGKPAPATISVTELRRLQSTGEALVGGLDGTSASMVTTASATPSGFTLQQPGIRRSDYVYDSDSMYQASYHCSNPSNCQLEDEVKLQLHQVALGGSSHTWQLRLSMSQVANPANLTWTYWATYWCGVNIAGASDILCANGAAPSGASMTVNSTVYEPWGTANATTVFPMVAATSQFSSGTSVTMKFRGWDTFSTATTTKLSATSGTGS